MRTLHQAVRHGMDLAKGELAIGLPGFFVSMVS
jgi:hypothetical protein